MPNNLQILAYVKALQDRAKSNIAFIEDRERERLLKPNGYGASSPFVHKAYLQDLESLEQFIKGAE